MGFNRANFGLPKPFRSRIRSTDGRTDRHRPLFYNAPPTEVGGIITGTGTGTGTGSLYCHCNLDEFDYFRVGWLLTG